MQYIQNPIKAYIAEVKGSVLGVNGNRDGSDKPDKKNKDIPSKHIRGFTPVPTSGIRNQNKDIKML